MGGLQPFSGVRTVVLVNRRISGKALTTVEYLTGVLVGQFPVSVVAQSADGLIGLVKPDGAAPVTVGRAFGIVGGSRRKRNIGGEFGNSQKVVEIDSLNWFPFILWAEANVIASL